MAVVRNSKSNTRHIRAILAALLMTGLIGLVTLALGANALVSKNVVEVQSAPGISQSLPQGGSDPANLQTIQDLVTLYQAREQTYLSELNQAAQQLDKANTQIQQDQIQLQQYQSLVGALQNAGLIRIASDGQILVPRGFEEEDHEDHD